MKKIVAVGLVVLALIAGSVYVQNVRAQDTTVGRSSWWQPSTWNWGAYCPWNYWNSGSANYPGYRRGYGWGGCGMGWGWGPGYPGYSNPSQNPQAPEQPTQKR